ncbi:MAG: hypothetical protein ACOCTN_03980 [Candidatus Natronoplasma sp.]
MLFSQKLTLLIAIWTGIVLLLVGTHSTELFVIMILIGILIARELSSVYIRPSIAYRLDVFIQVGIVVFTGIVMRRILDILEII